MLPIYNPFRIADIHRTNRPIAGQVKPYSGNHSSSAKQQSDIGARPAIWQRNTRLIDSIRGTTIIIRLPCARIGSHSTLFRIRKWSRRYSQAEERAQQRCSCVTRGRKRRWKSEVKKRKAAETYVAGTWTSLVPVATSVNRVYILDRPINWLTESRTRLALCNRGAPSFSFQGVQERQPTDQSGRQANEERSKARQQGRPFRIYLLPPAATKGPHREYYYPGAATATKRDRRSPHHLLTFSHRRLN